MLKEVDKMLSWYSSSAPMDICGISSNLICKIQQKKINKTRKSIFHKLNYLKYVYELLLCSGKVERHSSSLLNANVLGGAILAVQKLPQHHEELSPSSSLLQCLDQTRCCQVRLLNRTQELNNLKKLF